MSDREILAYAIIVIAGVVYAAAIARWWYMSPNRRLQRRDRKERALYEARQGSLQSGNGASNE